jgi:tetratricopeptide (TPR) repeat protein
VNPFVKNGPSATPDRNSGQRTGPGPASVDRQLQAHDSDRVYQAGGNQYFYAHGSPGKGPAAATNTIPRNIAVFTGRAPELRTLWAAARRATDSTDPIAIHAIDGMPGVGKTALAVHAAHLLRTYFPDGQLFVEMHGHTPGHRPTDPADALYALLLADGMPPEQIPVGVDVRAAMWRARVADRRMLLILDDAEGHAQVTPLLPGTGRCLVVVTSRRRLTGLVTRHATVTISLDALPPDEAATLFTRLVQRQLDRSDTDSVAALVRSCGYLPLAISLLAARLRPEPQWTVGDLLDTLASTHDKLSHMRAEDIEVAAAFGVSYRHLPAARRRFFRRLGLHPGPDIDVYAAATLDDTTVSLAHAHLESLYQDHLLDQPELGRFRMHDLVAQHARNLAENDPAEEREQATDRLRTYYLQTANRASILLDPRSAPARTWQHPVSTPNPELASADQAMVWMRQEAANLLACLKQSHERDGTWFLGMSAAVAPLLRRTGPWQQAIDLHRMAARLAGIKGDRSAEAGAAYSVAILLRRIGDHVGAVDALGRALAGYRHVNDRRGVADVLNEFAAIHQSNGDLGSATEMVDEALDIYRDLGDRLGEAAALKNLAVVRYMADDCTQATAALRAALAIYEHHDDPLARAQALFHLAVVHRMTDDYGAARQVLDEALPLFERNGDRLGQANVHHNLGVIYGMTDLMPAARRELQEALATYTSLGNLLGQANTLKHLGIVHRRTGDLSAAATVLERAHALYSDLPDPFGQAAALHNLAEVNRMAGDVASARQRLGQALRMYRELGNRLGEAEVLNHSGALFIQLGDAPSALADYQLALRLARAVDSPLEEARALRGAANCAAHEHQDGLAIARLRRALQILRRIGSAEAAQVADELATLTPAGTETETA